MNTKTIEDVFIHLLSDTYSAEKQLTRALAKLARATSNETECAPRRKLMDRLNVLIKLLESIEPEN